MLTNFKPRTDFVPRFEELPSSVELACRVRLLGKFEPIWRNKNLRARLVTMIIVMFFNKVYTSASLELHFWAIVAIFEPRECL